MLLRMLEKYWGSHHADEFLEALIFRYKALLTEKGEDLNKYADPTSIEDVMTKAM